MATKTKAKAKKTAERADLVEKEPTQLHSDFTAYIQEQTGYEADEKSVQLATILRMDFQKSDANQARLQAAKSAREQVAQERAERAEARKAAKAEKTEAKSAKKSTAKAPEKKAAGKAPAKKAPARRKGKAAAKATEETF